MDIKECYEKMNADFNDVINRLSNETIVLRIVKKFVTDTSYKDLKEGLENKDPKKAFRGAHTLKGVCLNLGFKQFTPFIQELTEKLRPQTDECLEETQDLFDKVTKIYNQTINALKELD
jgi:histidine phosphotransfer protein HptB